MQLIRTQGGNFLNPAHIIDFSVSTSSTGRYMVMGRIPGDELLIAAFDARTEADEALARTFNKLKEGHSVDFLFQPAVITDLTPVPAPWGPGEKIPGIFKRKADPFDSDPINDDSPVVTQLGTVRVSDAVPGEEEGFPNG